MQNRNLIYSGQSDPEIEMAKIELKIADSELEQNELDCFEKIWLIEQADSIWVELEVELPPVENCIEPRGFVSEEPDVPAQLGESLEKYTQRIAQVQKFAASISNSVYSIEAKGNRIRIGQPFEGYEAAKAQADEWEDHQLPVWYQVTLEALESDLPQESLERVVEKRRNLGDRHHE